MKFDIVLTMGRWHEVSNRTSTYRWNLKLSISVYDVDIDVDIRNGTNIPKQKFVPSEH